MIREAKEAIATVTWRQVINLAAKALVVVATALGGLVVYQGRVVIDRLDELASRIERNGHELARHERELAIIKATGYTTADAARDIGAIRDAVARRPEWVVEEFRELNGSIKDLRREVAEARKANGN